MKRKHGKYDWERFEYEKLPTDHIDRLTLDMIPANSKVLELGCATGYHSRYLQEEKNCEVIGVDMEKAVVTKATPHMSKLLIADLNFENTWKKIAKYGPYDVVLASNLIEHLIDPWSALKQIRKVLKRTGSAVIVIPNIAFWRSRLKLLRGMWQYEDYGTLDRTHIKFFTLFTLRSALQDAGLTPVEEAYDPAGGAKWFTPLLRMFPNAYANQVVIRATRKKHGAQKKIL